MHVPLLARTVLFVKINFVNDKNKTSARLETNVQKERNELEVKSSDVSVKWSWRRLEIVVIWTHLVFFDNHLICDKETCKIKEHGICLLARKDNCASSLQCIGSAQFHGRCRRPILSSELYVNNSYCPKDNQCEDGRCKLQENSHCNWFFDTFEI